MLHIDQEAIVYAAKGVFVNKVLHLFKGARNKDLPTLRKNRDSVVAGCLKVDDVQNAYEVKTLARWESDPSKPISLSKMALDKLQG